MDCPDLPGCQSGEGVGCNIVQPFGGRGRPISLLGLRIPVSFTWHGFTSSGYQLSILTVAVSEFASWRGLVTRERVAPCSSNAVSSTPGMHSRTANPLQQLLEEPRTPLRLGVVMNSPTPNENRDLTDSNNEA